MLRITHVKLNSEMKTLPFYQLWPVTNRGRGHNWASAHCYVQSSISPAVSDDFVLGTGLAENEGQGRVQTLTSSTPAV